MKGADEHDLATKFQQLCRMTDEYMSELTPQHRDRQMQIHLAQARGPRRNGDFLREMTDLILQMRAGQQDNKRST